VIARRPFAAWVVVGIILGLGVAGLWVVALPLAVVAIIVVTRRAREPDDALGAACGVGLVLLLSSSATVRLVGFALLVGGLGLHALIGRLGGPAA
jgi:hypothetical protein